MSWTTAPNFSWLRLVNIAVFTLEDGTAVPLKFEHLTAAVHYARWIKRMGFAPREENHTAWFLFNTVDGKFVHEEYQKSPIYVDIPDETGIYNACCEDNDFSYDVSRVTKC